MFEFADSDLESEETRLDTIDSDESKEDLSSFGFTINAQYIRYLTITDDIALFCGAGPFFNFFDQTAERIVNFEGNEILRKSTRNTYTIGLDMLLGVEWWFDIQMSYHQNMVLDSRIDLLRINLVMMFQKLKLASIL